MQILMKKRGKQIKVYNNTLNALLDYSNLTAAPLFSVTAYARFIGFLTNYLRSEDYTTIDDIPYKQLYHLSGDSNLDSGLLKIFNKPKVLNPKFSQSGLGQFLPKRISFAEEIIDCAYGTPIQNHSQNAKCGLHTSKK